MKKLSKISTSDLFEEIVSLFNSFLIAEISSRQGLYNIRDRCRVRFNFPRTQLTQTMFDTLFLRFNIVFPQFCCCVPSVLTMCSFSFNGVSPQF